MAIYSEIFPLNMVIFHSYVSLPEGTSIEKIDGLQFMPCDWLLEILKEGP